jgi:hypothetical protein
LLAVVGIATGALLPETADPRTAPILAKLQNIVARPGLFLGIILVSIGLRGASGWGDIWPVLLALSLVAAAMLPITIAVMLERGLGGVGQRLIFVPYNEDRRQGVVRHNKALQRTINSLVQLTLVAFWRHTLWLGSGPASAVAGR